MISDRFGRMFSRRQWMRNTGLGTSIDPDSRGDRAGAITEHKAGDMAEGMRYPPKDHKSLRLLIQLANFASMEVKTAVKNGQPDAHCLPHSAQMRDRHCQSIGTRVLTKLARTSTSKFESQCGIRTHIPVDTRSSAPSHRTVRTLSFPGSTPDARPSRRAAGTGGHPGGDVRGRRSTAQAW